MRFNHIGVPTTDSFDNEIDLPDLKMTVSDHKNNPYGVQLMRFHKDAPYHEAIKTMSHAAFEVDSIDDSIKGEEVIVEKNSPMEGLKVAFILVNGAPIELMEIDRSICGDSI